MTNKVSYAVDIVGLSKSFQRQSVRKGYTTIKSALFSVFSRNKVKEKELELARTHHVIRNLTMRVPKGASVGVIGRNGSGKSTLLKLITGIYKPSAGTVRLNGRVSALIELGAGFHPDFTGRENLYLGGVMHGLSTKEIDAIFEDIVSFAELRDVIDDPVRTYSSGMFMRLGFSLAIHTNPDVLIVDEVLAVGDARFVTKCKDKVSELRREGKTLLLVSHDLDAVERWCDEVVWLHEGNVKDRGDPRRVIDQYRQWVESTESEELLAQDHQPHIVDAVSATDTPTEQARRWGSREIEITSVTMLSADLEEKKIFHPDDEIRIKIDYTRHQPVRDVVFGVGIHRQDGISVFGTNTDIDGITLPALLDRGSITFVIAKNMLSDSKYVLDIACHRADGYPYDYHQKVSEFAVRHHGKQVGVYVPTTKWIF